MRLQPCTYWQLKLKFTGRQHTRPCCVTGAFVEQDGERSPPAFFQTYVAVLPVLLGVLVPAAGLTLIVKQGNGYLGACTLGLYLLELAAQLVSEGVYIKTSKLHDSFYIAC